MAPKPRNYNAVHISFHAITHTQTSTTATTKVDRVACVSSDNDRGYVYPRIIYWNSVEGM